MATKTVAPQGKAPFMQGSVIWQKKGPLPVWAWALIGLALIFIVTWWRRNRATGAATESVTGEGQGMMSAPPVFIVPQAATPAVNVQLPATVPTAPAGGGANPPLTTPSTASVPLEYNIYTWIDDLNRSNPGLGLDFGKLEMFNPGMRKYIRWDPGTGGAKVPKFYKWHPTLGIPPMRIR